MFFRLPARGVDDGHSAFTVETATGRTRGVIGEVW